MRGEEVESKDLSIFSLTSRRALASFQSRYGAGGTCEGEANPHIVHCKSSILLV